MLHCDAISQMGSTIKPCANSAGIVNKCIKQKTVTDSSTEAKLLALHETTEHIGWIADIYVFIHHVSTSLRILDSKP